MNTKKLTKKIIATAAILVSALTPAFAETPRSITMTLKQYVNTCYIEEEEPGRRLPSRHLDCTITEEGIVFNNGSTPEFVSYEICDTEGATVASFGDETSFIEVLFTMTGEYQLRLVSADYEYVGWVSL